MTTWPIYRPGLSIFSPAGRRSTHAAVIVYSSRAKLLVSLWSGQNFRKFLSSVNRIPYYGGGTRIDLALRLANSGVFSRMKGMRAGVPKIFILMTDGYQTKTKGYTPLDQAVLPLRKKGNDCCTGEGEL